MTRIRPLPLLIAALVLSAGAALAQSSASGGFPGLPEPLPPPGLDDPGLATAPADAFMAALTGLCGQAFAGKVRVDTPASPDDAFAGKPLVMHVRECDAGTVRIPFHVGDDHSRTWVLTRTAGGLRLKHDHRHADGSPDAVTMYGGDTAGAGSAGRQSFPVDAESVAMFTKEGLAASVTNTWSMEIDPGRTFVYELSRPGGRLFQVEFDLGRPVPLPPAPWGAAETRP